MTDNLFSDLFAYRRLTDAALNGRLQETRRLMKRIPTVIHDDDCPGDHDCICHQRDDRYWDADE